MISFNLNDVKNYSNLVGKNVKVITYNGPVFVGMMTKLGDFNIMGSELVVGGKSVRMVQVWKVIEI